MQVAIYCRISQDRTGEALGVERQREDCEQLAATLGWTVVETYVDNDVSATGSKPRPSYRAMLDAVEAGQVGGIIAWHPDRLYRRMADLEELVSICERYEVAIRTVQAGEVDLSSPSGRMTARIMGSVARYEVEHKADRWKRAWRQRREAGQAPGGQRLFGYDDDGTLLAGEAAVVRLLAAEVIAGASLNGLAAQLNRSGKPTAAGGQWRAQTVRKLLLNPRIAGHSTMRGEIIGRGDWQPIIDDTTWQTVRGLLAARNRVKAPRVALLAGLVHCGREGCGQPLRSGRTSGGTRRYSCVSAAGLTGCGRLTVVAEPVDELVEDHVARPYLSRPKIRAAIAAAQAGGQTHILAEIEAQNRRLAEIEQTIDAGVQSVDMLARSADRVRERIDTLQGRLGAVAPVPIPDDVWSSWPVDLGERRRLVELVIARVWVDPAERRRFDPSRVRVDPTPAVVAAAG